MPEIQAKSNLSSYTNQGNSNLGATQEQVKYNLKLKSQAESSIRSIDTSFKRKTRPK